MKSNKDSGERILTARFEMKCLPEEHEAFKAIAHQREQSVSAFVREAARAALQGAGGLAEFSPEELHVVWVAATAYLSNILTGETVIVSDPENNWPKRLGTAIEKLTRAMNRHSGSSGKSTQQNGTNA